MKNMKLVKSIGERATLSNEAITRILVICFILTSLIAAPLFASAATPGISGIPVGKIALTTGEIIVNGARIEAPRPSVTGGVIMLPLRAIAEALGFDVLWNESERSVLVGEANLLWIGLARLSNDGGLSVREFGPPPEIIDGRTFVPISFFNFGLSGLYARVEDGKVIIDSEGVS